MKGFKKIFIYALLFLTMSPLTSCTFSSGFSTDVSVESSNEVVSISGDFEEGAEVVSEIITGEEKENALDIISKENYDESAPTYVFDISLEKEGVKIQPNGDVSVTIYIPGIDVDKNYTVYHIKHDNTYDLIEPVVSEDKVEFITPSFSIFIIAQDEEEINEPLKEVLVSVNILPYSFYGMLIVNDVPYPDAASYKTTHKVGDIIKFEAVGYDEHHFRYWMDDKVLSRESTYQIVVGDKEIAFSAYFTDGHEINYTNITETTHTEKCQYCDYNVTVEHTFFEENIIKDPTCKEKGIKELICPCSKTKTEEIDMVDHHYIDGVCEWCGKEQLYRRVNLNGVENPNGAYILMGKTYCEKAGEIEGLLTEQVGSPYLSLDNWTPFDFGNGDTESTYYCDTTYEGLNYRGVFVNDYRKDNDDNQITNRIWTGIYWFQEREALWEIVKVNESNQAYLISNNIWTCQRFAESDTGDLSYQNSWIRNWLNTVWLDELLSERQQSILVSNENCFNDKIFLPSLEEVGPNRNKDFGLYRYPFALGAFKDITTGLGGIYSPYWLRDDITVGEDGKNYATCINSHNPFNEPTKYLVNKTFVGVVPAIIIQL